MFWLVKELIERAITSLVELSKGETREEKLVSTIKNLVFFITIMFMTSLWALGSLLETKYMVNNVVNEKVITDVVDVLALNEELGDRLEKVNRENRLLIGASIKVNVENKWLRDNLKSALEKLEASDRKVRRLTKINREMNNRKPQD